MTRCPRCGAQPDVIVSRRGPCLAGHDMSIFSQSGARSRCPGSFTAAPGETAPWSAIPRQAQGRAPG